MRTCFSQYGSLYYKQDLGRSAPSVEYTSQNDMKIVDDRFALGLLSGRQNNDDGGIEINFDSGPVRVMTVYDPGITVSTMLLLYFEKCASDY